MLRFIEKNANAVSKGLDWVPIYVLSVVRLIPMHTSTGLLKVQEESDSCVKAVKRRKGMS